MIAASSDPPPLTVVYLDTSFVADAIVAGGRDYQLARSFCERLCNQHSTVIVSDFVRVELAQAAKAIANSPAALQVSTRRRWRLHRWELYRDARAAWYQHCFDSYDALLSEFAIADEIAMTRDIIDASQAFMVDFHLDSYDAIHAATAIAARATTIVTMDRHFRVLATTGQISILELSQPAASA